MRSLALAPILALALAGCGGKPAADTSTDGNAAAPTESNTVAAVTTETTGSPATIGANGPGLVSTDTFVEQASLSDMYEIQASNLATKKSQSADIKKFAAQMIADHTRTTAQLKGLLAKNSAAPQPPAELDPRRAALIADLNKAKPDEFDKLYLDQQTQAHREALGLMNSYGTHGEDAALKSFANETKPAIQMHLDMASKLDHAGADEPKDK